MVSSSKLSLRCLLAVILGGTGAAAAVAQGAGDEVRYVPLQPAFVCNFGYSENGRLQYLKADVSIRVSSQEAEMAARYHLPALRNSLVLLLSRQDEATVASSAGRELLRGEALQALNGILEDEEGVPYIEDLLFTNFIVQR